MGTSTRPTRLSPEKRQHTATVTVHRACAEGYSSVHRKRAFDQVTKGGAKGSDGGSTKEMINPCLVYTHAVSLVAWGVE